MKKITFRFQQRRRSLSRTFLSRNRNWKTGKKISIKPLSLVFSMLSFLISIVALLIAFQQNNLTVWSQIQDFGPRLENSIVTRTYQGKSFRGPNESIILDIVDFGSRYPKPVKRKLRNLLKHSDSAIRLAAVVSLSRLGERNFYRLNFISTLIENWSFKEIYFEGCTFKDCFFNNASFDKDSILKGCNFWDIFFLETIESGLEATFDGSRLESCDFKSTKTLKEGYVHFRGAVFSGSNLVNTSLTGQDFYRCAFMGTNFFRSKLRKCFFDNCNFNDLKIMDKLIIENCKFKAAFNNSDAMSLAFGDPDYLGSLYEIKGKELLTKDDFLYLGIMGWVKKKAVLLK